MTPAPVPTSLLAALLLAAAACAPVPEAGTRLSTQGEPVCLFSDRSCEDLHRLRPPAW
jgi:hypothetical protein